MSDTLLAAIKAIDKQYGTGTVKSLSEIPQVPVVSTGLLSLDSALGIGGLPLGRIVELYGPEASGKSTLTLEIIREAQKAGHVCAYMDMENALDASYAAVLGVDTETLVTAQPECGEHCLEITRKLVETGEVGVIVIDSVSALVPRAEMEGEIGDANIGLQARLMGQACRMLSGLCHRNNCLVIFINQIRIKVGGFSRPGAPPPETTSGGKSLGFYATTRLEIRRKETLTKASKPVGQMTRIRVIKHKLAPPKQEIVVPLMWGVGFDKLHDLVDIAIAKGVIEQKGGWFYYGEDKQQGKPAVVKWVRDTEGMQDEIRTKVLEVANDPTPEV